MLHSQIGHREEVDFRLLVVGSQTASLTPSPSFAHNLSCKCPNCQCEAIFDIYVSRPSQWHQEHLNARCFASFCQALNIRESRRIPNPNFSKCWASPPHLAKVGVRQLASYIPIDSHACKLNGLNVHWKQLLFGLLEIPLEISYTLETMIGTHFYYSNYFLMFLELQSTLLQFILSSKSKARCKGAYIHHNVPSCHQNLNHCGV
jgi:hypothetical protein